ncbi:hypothetical protein [Collinsella intestinalis]|uniref:hypothetical protein n=1 Tax=Collinsella intestinalis TaxID=147207 RepID=UPI00195E8556|nr:hypothetical protein [Collinsella intestinalis]MBM6943258.1 hypothetical protein [Collinsella intestinalis]
MAFDPVQEDCLRLTLETLRREHVFPLENEAVVQRCMSAYQTDPAQLIVHDRDRSFHLVAVATEAVDYRIPFIADDAEAERLTVQAEHQLQEACDLDPGNWDARRMLVALGAASNDEYVAYLIDYRSDLERDLERMRGAAADPYDREFALDLGRRPYLRWLGALATHALIAGKYRLALSAAEDCLAAAPDDPGEARHTAELALAKLEATREELAQFRRAHASAYLPPVPFRRRQAKPERPLDAWSLIAELACAYHDLDFAGATRSLRTLMRTYARTAQPLYYQAEFPEGIFARVHVMPGSEDELILALSEATPLLQEGLGAPDNASLATWIATHPLVQEELASLDAAPGPLRHGSMGGDN